jgi:uncharacterized protein
MFKTPNDFTKKFMEMFDSNMNLATAALDSYKQLATVQLEAATAMLHEFNMGTKNICTASNMNDAMLQMQTMVANSIEVGLAKAQDIYGVFANSKKTFAEASSAAMQNAQQTLTKSVESITALNPSLAKAANESLQHIMSNVHNITETAHKVSEKVVAAANKNIEDIAQATANTIKSASKK